jgi:SET domain-containing protein
LNTFSFKKNRFGETKCILAIRNIEKGEEILVHYSYAMKGNFTPEWYKELHAKTYKKK